MLSRISILAVLLVAPAVFAGRYHRIPDSYFSRQPGRSSRPIVAIVENEVYRENLVNPPPRIPGYLGPDRQFYAAVVGYAAFPHGGNFIAGSLAPGGVFYPGGNDGTPQSPVAGIVENGVFNRNDLTPRPRLLGVMDTVDGRFYEGAAPSAQPGRYVAGAFAAGGVFYPAGNNGTPSVPPVGKQVPVGAPATSLSAVNEIPLLSF